MNSTREHIPDRYRLRTVADFARIRSEGRAIRGAHCLVVRLACPGEAARMAFVASRKGVGGAVQRNRARRRLREIVRRRWPRMVHEGLWLMFVPYRSALNVPHLELELDIERLLTQAGAMPRPAED